MGAKIELFSRSEKVKVAFFAIALCLLSALNIDARGQTERQSRARLAEVERLIDEKRYNEAILLLTQVIKEDPDRFDAAEQLMGRIRKIREEYNRNFDELIAALFVETDLGKALELIKKLEELDPNPGQGLAEALALARSGTEVVHFLNSFRDLIQRAKVRMEAGEYEEALAIYLEGFQIAKDRFDRADYGNIVVDSVNAAVADVKEAVAEFETLDAGLEEIVGRLRAVEIDAVDREAAEASARLGRMMALKGRVDRAGNTFRSQNQRIRESSPEGTVDLFLFFAGQLVSGPDDATGQGIAFALDAMWQRTAQELQEPLQQRGEAAYRAALQQLRRDSFSQARSSLDETAGLFDALLDLQTDWPLRIDPGRSFAFDDAGLQAAREALPSFLHTQEYLQAVDSYRALIATTIAVDELREKEVSSLEEVFDDRDQLAVLSQSSTDLRALWERQLELYRESFEYGLALNSHVAQAQEVIADIDGTMSRIEALDIRYLDRVMRVRGVELEQQFRQYQAQYEEAVKLQEGIEVTLEPIVDEEGQVIETPARLEKFPSQALAIYRPLAENLQDLISTARTMLIDTLAKQGYMQQSEELQMHVSSLRGLLDRGASLEAELDRRIEESRQATLQAERYRREGMLRLQQARSSVNARHYSEAREHLQSAREAFDSSLAFQEDAEVRRIRDEELVALSRRIVDMENSVVINEVRELIDAGRRLYAQGDFSGAEQTLLKAQARWLDTNPEANEEISFWLALVRNAVTATTGREIAVSDPLYKEMSQLYNLAYNDYLAGKRLIEQGQQGEALRLLRRAEERIAKILIPFPYNAQARVLTLRILQISDPDAFRSRVTEIYNEALRTAGTSPQAAYAALKDIEQIQPQYPGLQTAIRNLEVSLGLRVAPPDPAKIAQSRDLYVQAKSIRDRNLRDLFPVALDQLNEAIRLNPDNREAIALKDQILRDTGGTRENVLSSNDQRLLREAEAKYLEGRYFEALAIIEQLLKNRNNRNNVELLELEKRVRAKTG